MRQQIFDWVRSCAGCIPAAARLRESTGIIQSWPITTPFSIISVDLWAPGDMADYKGRNHLLNSMCDMTQFVVSIATEFVTASHLARLFMEGVLLKFGLCALIVVDADIKFKGTFAAMAKALNIKIHVAASRNHRTVGVERFHRFLNHSTTIFAEERGTSECFVECGMISAYAWNASPIDNTDIVRSVPAIGRELKFPLDISLADIPAPIDSASVTVADYLRNVRHDATFSRELLAWLVDDRRTQHRERANDKRCLVEYKEGDVVMIRSEVHSNKDKGIVKKLVYQSRGHYTVVTASSKGTYNCRKYGKPQGTIKKFRTEDMYLLPPLIYPGESLDTADLRYLNSDFAPLHHPFSKSFDIEAYNTRWFDSNPAASINLPSPRLTSKPISKPLPVVTPTVDVPSPAKLPRLVETVEKSCRQDSPLHIDDDEVAKDSIPMIAANLHTAISNSADKLFFVCYTPAQTMRHRWYLVQAQPSDSVDGITSGKYLCSFFQRHTSDHNKSDSRSRWWPEWRELHWLPDNSCYDYGARVLFSPRNKPDLQTGSNKLQKYGKFSEELNLCDGPTYLMGPFNFSPKDHSTPANSIITEDTWIKLSEICQAYSILSPSIGPPSADKVANVVQLREQLKNCMTTVQNFRMSSLDVALIISSVRS